MSAAGELRTKTATYTSDYQLERNVKYEAAMGWVVRAVVRHSSMEVVVTYEKRFEPRVMS